MKSANALLAFLFASSALAETPKVGLLTAEGLNVATIYRTVYYGSCPGIYDSSVEAFFVSESTPAATGRNIVARNVTPGMETNPYPFTDRKYVNGRSEHTYLALDHKHRTRTLSVASGENNFDYSIIENGQLLEQGAFKLLVNVEEQQLPRNQICNWQQKCFPTPNGGWHCQNEWVCRCP